MRLKSPRSDVKKSSRYSSFGIARFYRQLAARPLISFLIPFAVVLVGRALLLSSVPPPEPLIQDEFSYLLAGDTFASFRVTNPPHPLWEHFETIHELMQPTYMSKYPPMQGLLLAFGQVCFGVPWLGVILSMAFFCGLLPWAFRAWLPCDWALTGALLATCKIGIMSYWTESFWGGGAAAIGGALVLGASKRLSIRFNPWTAVAFTLGGAILANSRPFEGLIFTTGCTGYLFWRWLRSGTRNIAWPTYPRRLAQVICVIGLPILLAMGYYNYRITGSVTELPYQAYERQYSFWTPFVWQQKPSPIPVYRHDFIRRAWVDWDGEHKSFERTHWELLHLQNLLLMIRFYFGPTFYLGGFLFIPALFFGDKNRSILGLLLFYYVGTRVMSDISPHYTAPASALIYLAVTATLRSGWHLALGGIPVGKGLVIALISLFLMFTAASLTSYDNRFLFYKPHFIEKRHAVLSFLEQQAGRQLVIVRHGPLHDVNEIWTFNKADIDASTVVWANDMTSAENQRLIDYYGGKRKVWMLDDDAELTLRPYGDSKAKPLIDIKNPPLALPLPK